MKNRLAALGILGFGTMFAAAACSSDDDALSPGPATSGAGAGGTSSGGTASGGKANGGTSSGGASSGGTPTAGSAGTSGSSAGSNMSQGGEAGAGGVASPGGEAGMGGALEGGAGAGGAGGSEDENVSLTPTTCGYTEVESDSSQNSSLNAQNGLKVVCGKFDTGHYNAGDGLLDKDSYVMTVAADDLLRLELPSFKGLTRIEVTIDTATIVITQPVTVFHLSPFGGSAILRLSAYSAADLPAAIPYQISVAKDAIDTRCAANKNAATFTEAGDGANNRGNDVYQFVNTVATATVANDSAEVTGITLAQSSYRVDGVSADVMRVGDFLDGDSYAFRSGPTTTQVTLRADWAGSHNIDLFVMQAGSTSSVGYTKTFTTSSPEYATVRVQPNTDYVAFVGAFFGTAPSNYSLTMCGESYAFNGP